MTSANDDKEALRTLQTLRMLRENLDTSEITPADHETILKWLKTDEDPADKFAMKSHDLGGNLFAGVMKPISFDGLEPRLVPVTMAIQIFDMAIRRGGLPGIEKLIEDFLNDVGFDEKTIQEVLLDMLSRAPEDDPGDLN